VQSPLLVRQFNGRRRTSGTQIRQIRDLGTCHEKYGVLPAQQHICGLDRTSFGPKGATK
jgi:hypothetical protein